MPIAATPGKVYLVGAGPGDPGLLTRRAGALLSTAEVVAYDELVSPSILCMVSVKAELVCVGHRGYGDSPLRTRMHPMVIKRALEGKDVVRLKSGDPFIFGRGAEECGDLAQNGIPFEVVPGVTSALAAAAYAGFPLTHRDYASDLLITSGHDLRGGSPSRSNWEALGKSCGTLAVYMAGSKVRENCRRLIEMGRDPATPAAFISHATRGSQRVLAGTLENLPEKIESSGKKAAALLLVGEVVRLREKLAWLEQKPLHGVTLLAARSRPGNSSLACRLREEGADVLEAPCIETLELESYSEFEEKLQNVSGADSFVFACAASVDYFFDRLRKSRIDIRKFAGVPFGAIGSQSGQKLAQHGIVPAFTMRGRCREALEEQKGFLRNLRPLIFTSSGGRSRLTVFLQDLKISADFVPLYHAVPRFPEIPPPAVDFVVAPSSSSVKFLLKGPWGPAFREVPMIVLGPSAKQAALDFGAVRIHMTDADDPGFVIPLLTRLAPGRPQYAQV